MKVENNVEVNIQKASYDTIDINSLVNPLGGMNHFVKKGDNVLLKTNLLNATDPTKAVVTHPAVIASVAQSVQKAGGVPYIGDSPSGSFSKRRLKKVYQQAGLIKLAEETGIQLNYDTGTKRILIPNGKQLQKTRICNFVLEADKIIALPKIKTHSLMMLSLATKIMFGAIPGLIKASYHAKYLKTTQFADMLLDLLTVVKPSLYIMDGIIGMEGDGPMSGKPVSIQSVLASVHPIALDLAVCDILGVEPLGIPTLKQAKLRKLWPKKIIYPLLSPDEIKYKDFILPSTANYLLTGEKKPAKSPVITSNCVACGECVNICPNNAINILKQKARIDYAKCIKCYCCHEICTFNAINLEVVKSVNV